MLQALEAAQSWAWEQLLLQLVLPGPAGLLGSLGAGTPSVGLGQVPWGWNTSFGGGTGPLGLGHFLWGWDISLGAETLSLRLRHFLWGWDMSPGAGTLPSRLDLRCCDKEGQITGSQPESREFEGRLNPRSAD